MLPVSQLLSEGGLDVSQVKAQLDGVDPERVPVRLAPWWVRAAWPSGIVAMTVPWVIWVHPTVMDWEPARRARLMVHELAHSAQLRRLGWAGFSIAYLKEYLRGRLRGMSHQEAYRSNPLEVEANELRARFT